MKNTSVGIALPCEMVVIRGLESASQSMPHLDSMQDEPEEGEGKCEARFTAAHHV